MAAWFFLTLALAPFGPEPPTTLTLVWHDSYHLFPAVGLRRLADEMENLFRKNGMPVKFHAASENEDLRIIPEPRVNAIVIPREDARFGLSQNTMAAALGVRGEKYSIFVFYPGVRRTLGHRDGETSPRQVTELARALARVVAHELVHVLAPERGHSLSGLMSGKLRRKELLSDDIVLDGPSLERANATLKEWSCRAPGSKFPIPAGGLRSIVGPEVEATCPSVR